MLEFTGERYLPEVEGQIALEHLHRYFLAARLVKGKEVLDIASGEGYGSAILAESAKSVVGVDISRETIEHAGRKYAGISNLRYLVGDCGAIPLEGASVDAVVSFETIEHHDKHEAMMSEIKRVLRPGGLLVISSPDRHNYSEVPGYRNEFHVKELYRHEFESLLAAHFRRFMILGQRVGYGSFVLSDSPAGFVNIRRRGDSIEEAAGIAAPVYLIAVASDGELPFLEGGLLEQELENSDVVRELTRKVAEREGQVAGLTHAVEVRNGEVAELRRNLETLTAALDASNRAFDERAALIASLQAGLADGQRELEQVYRSRSWRLTKWLRFLGRVSRGEWASIAASLRRYVSAVRGGGGGHFIAPSQRVPSPGSSGGTRSARVSPAVASTAKALSPAVASVHHEPRSRMLLVSYYCPSRAHGGGLRVLDIYSLIRRRAPDVELHLYTHRRPSIDWPDADIDRIFDRVYWSPSEELSAAGLSRLAGDLPWFDVIDLQFHQAAFDIDGFRRHGRRILFTPMESLTRVLFLQARRSGPTASPWVRMRELARGFRSVAEEVLFSFKADHVICVSRSDAAFLRMITCLRKVQYLETGVSEIEFGDGAVASLEPRPLALTGPVVLYVAYFGSQTNIDALKWYLDEVHPQVRARVPGYRLQVVGRGDLSGFAAYAGADVELVGEVQRLAPSIAGARVGIAPALGGSGFRGKVNQYALFGVPSVVSPIAAKGLAYCHGHDVLIGETAHAFADHCVSLLTDAACNDRIGSNARATCLARYSWDAKWPAIARFYGLAEVR
ncbi:MAG TPA: methyltransferase domain-containing protein [Burkholderiaceae bacterium]|nr:methyltransferase domain-containing protein [Burkholderiaceae bacterium]